MYTVQVQSIDGGGVLCESYCACREKRIVYSVQYASVQCAVCSVWVYSSKCVDVMLKVCRLTVCEECAVIRCTVCNLQL